MARRGSPAYRLDLEVGGECRGATRSRGCLGEKQAGAARRCRRPALPAGNPVSLQLALRIAISRTQRFRGLVWSGTRAHRLRGIGLLALAILDGCRRVGEPGPVAANRL